MRSIKRELRKRLPLIIALAIVSLLLGVYLFLWPTLSTIFGPASEESTPKIRLGQTEMFQSRLMTALMTLWFFTVGATIGSFLNVVVYRLPLGKSVIFKPSHCPYCQCKIKPRHNIPVLGWLSLNGRCSRCRLPISARYPTVEFICGTIFLLVFFVELISGGINLPVREPNEKVGVVRTVFDPQWDLISLSLYHLLLFCTLLTGSLIHWDRQKIPRRFWLTIGFFAVGLAGIWPHLKIVPWTIDQSIWGGNQRADAVIDSLFGALIGTVIGSFVALIVDAGRDTKLLFSKPVGLPIALGIIGSFLGWQATVSIALLALVAAVLLAFVQKLTGIESKIPWFLVVSIACLIHQVIWRAIYTLSFWQSANAKLAGIFGAFALIAILALVNRQLTVSEEV
jgi:leader peptidase (prepilin peptidase)/N-methyltransferase